MMQFFNAKEPQHTRPTHPLVFLGDLSHKLVVLATRLSNLKLSVGYLELSVDLLELILDLPFPRSRMPASIEKSLKLVVCLVYSHSLFNWHGSGSLLAKSWPTC